MQSEDAFLSYLLYNYLIAMKDTNNQYVQPYHIAHNFCQFIQAES